jgi:hypothetical protein
MPTFVFPRLNLRRSLACGVVLAASFAVPRVAVAATVVHNVDANTDHMSLQDAIDNASVGDTLEIVAADHSEGPTVTIDRDLTLRGATGNEILRPAGDTHFAGDARAWFLVPAGIDVTVRDLSFDATGFLVHAGFLVHGGGRFENCSFRNVRYNESGPDYRGTAIFADGTRVDVTGSHFEGSGRRSVLLRGSGIVGAEVRDSVFIGKGDGNFLDYAVQVGAGAQATVVGNRIRDNRGVVLKDGSTSSGLLVSTYLGSGTQATILGNDVTDCTTGLGVGVGMDGADTSVVQASFNRFFGNGWAVDSTSTVVTTDAENNWYGCNGGPGTAGCDPVSGQIDSDPWLVLRLAAAPGPPLSPWPLTADVATNSDSLEVPGAASFPDGIGLTFATDSGSMQPALVPSAGGAAVSQLSAPPGPATVSVTLDGETVFLLVGVLSVLDVPTLSPLGAGLLLLSLLAAGGFFLRRRRRPA